MKPTERTSADPAYHRVHVVGRDLVEAGRHIQGVELVTVIQGMVYRVVLLGFHRHVDGVGSGIDDGRSL